MSLINRMLQELDKRHAAQGPATVVGPDSRELAQKARPVMPPRVMPVFFRYALAGAVLMALAAGIWVARPLLTQQSLTDMSAQLLARLRPTPQVPEAIVVATAPPSAPPQLAAAIPPAPAPSASQPAAAEEYSGIDKLRPATELSTPIKPRRAVTPPAAKALDKEIVAAIGADSSPSSVPDRPARETPKPETAPPKPRIGIAGTESGRIDKRVDVSPHERAEAEFRRAMIQVNQGRMAEGMDGLRTALGIDPGHETARRTLVALLLESRRIDEGAAVLQEGLAIAPDNSGFAMLLGRISVERGDTSGALALLQKHLSTAQSNPEYHAFLAALYQRLGRHGEAIEEYQTALRISAGAGAWWVGLGISQEAMQRQRDAIESFRRAKATGSLNPDLVAYVDQRLKQLR